MGLVFWKGMDSYVRAPRCRLCYGRNFGNGCCNWRATWSLADLARLVVAGEVEFLRELLGRRDVELRAGGTELKVMGSRDKCTFHRAGSGCTLRVSQRPLLCRTFLCAPHRLLSSPRHRRVYRLEYQRARELAGRITRRLHLHHDLEALNVEAFVREAPAVLDYCRQEAGRKVPR
ncbi:MAG TPA: hypothetical protein DCM14_07095 [Clostridiales bacterium UBA8153]|nr:hypothetical protein [Clostridiales bacterium UBA8153]